MNILFLTAYSVKSLKKNGLYEDLLNEFIKHKHKVIVLFPGNGETREVEKEDDYTLIQVSTGKFEKVNLIAKGFATIMLPLKYNKAIKRFVNIKDIDVLMYSTPPITLMPVVSFIKKQTNVFSYLLLKDIWPQAIVDLGALRKRGLAYKYLRKQEQKLYKLSDIIACTSKANAEYIISHNDSVANKISFVANGLSIEKEKEVNRIDIHHKYSIPESARVFFYGGNLGLPQDIDFLITCIEKCKNMNDAYFIICGAGTHAHKIKQYCERGRQSNLLFLDYLSQKEYEEMVASVDVCMVFLNHRFTVPNCPARFYTYMKYGKPVLACTDTASDIKDDIIEGKFGWWCESIDSLKFQNLVRIAIQSDLEEYGKNARIWFERMYTTEQEYNTIIDDYCDWMNGRTKE